MKVRRGVVAITVVAASLVAGAGVPGMATAAAGGTAVSLDPVAAAVPYDFEVDGTPPGPDAALATAGGWLLLATGATDAVIYDDNRDGYADGDLQTLVAGSRCTLDTRGSSLLTFAGSGTSAKYKSYLASYSADALGVAERASGTSCYQVDSVNGESLVLELDHDGNLGDAVASSAFLDMELKQGARVLAVASLAGTAVGWYDLQSGGNAGQALPSLVGLVPDTLRPPSTDKDGDGYPDAVKPHECQANADSGPDSKVGDNCRWPISTPSWLGDDQVYFDSLGLYAVSGSFSLKGGSDGRVPTESGPPADSGFPSTVSFFELAGGMLDCGAATPTKRRILDDEPEIRVRRLNNADGSSCTPVPYSLNNGSDDQSPFAQFLKPMADQPAAQFVLEIDWRVPVDTTSTQLPETSIDYETGGGDVQLGWCPNPIIRDLDVTYGEEVVGTYGYLDGIADLLAEEVRDQDDGHEGAWPGMQFACLGVQQAVVIDDETDWVRVSEQIYLLGDAFYRK